MTVYLFHGDDQALSDARLAEQVKIWRSACRRIMSLNGRDLTTLKLEEALTQQDFFAPPPVLVIRGLFTRPKSKARDALIAALAKVESDLALWEGKKLTPANLKLIPNAKIIVSNAPEKIWSFLNLLSPATSAKQLAESYQETLKQVKAQKSGETAVYVLAMVIWKVQQLIDASDDNFRGAPFQRASTLNQARRFQRPQLLTFHQQLLDLDDRAKTGRLRLSLQIELFLLLESTLFAS